jgi:hypothetical protein
MPTGVSLFVWLPEERAKWVEMRAKRDRAPRDRRRDTWDDWGGGLDPHGDWPEEG